MYRVISGFFDLQDNQYFYPLGALYPREGLEVSAERIRQLSTADNRMGYALIARVEENPKKAPRRRVKKDVDADM